MHYFFHNSETLRPTSLIEQDNNLVDPISSIFHNEYPQPASPIHHDSSPMRQYESPQHASPIRHDSSPMRQYESVCQVPSTIQKRLKNELRLQCELLMQEDDLETIQHNLEVLKSCRLSGRNDFQVTDRSKKMKLAKQPDFEPKNRKLSLTPSHIYSCLFGSDQIADKSKFRISHNVINAYLDLIATNFSQEKAIIIPETTLSGQKIYSNDFKRQKKSDEILALIPFHKNNEWCVQATGMVNHIFEKENLGYSESWQSGYSMLLRCTQILTCDNTEHSNRIITRFRKFLSDVLSNEISLIDYCYKCYKFLYKKSVCIQCPLTFCTNCINNNLCPRH